MYVCNWVCECSCTADKRQNRIFKETQQKQKGGQTRHSMLNAEKLKAQPTRCKQKCRCMRCSRCVSVADRVLVYALDFRSHNHAAINSLNRARWCAVFFQTRFHSLEVFGNSRFENVRQLRFRERGY